MAHFGLVAGMSWVPVQLLCVLRLSQPRTRRTRSRAVHAGVLDQLDTSVLLTVAAYLTTRSGTAAAGGAAASPGPPGTGRRDVAGRHQATWYFAEPLGVTRLEVPDADARQDAAQGTRIGLLVPGGTTRWFPRPRRVPPG